MKPVRFLQYLLTFLTVLLVSTTPIWSQGYISISEENSKSLRSNQSFRGVNFFQKSQAKQNLQQALVERKGRIYDLMAEHPAQVIIHHYPGWIKQQFPSELQPLIESEVVLEGELVAITECDSEHHQHHAEHYHLKAAGQPDIEIFFTGEPGLVTTPHIRLSGLLLDDRMVIDGEDTAAIQILSDMTPQVNYTTKKVAVILFNFQDDVQQPFSQAQARASIFTNTDSVNAYYKEVSFGQWTLAGRDRVDGDIYGWYTIPYSYTGSCDFNSWATAAMNEGKAQGANFDGYNNRLFLFPRATQCGWAGVAYVGGNHAWAKGLSRGTIAHELGHNYSMHHASSYSCTKDGVRVPISSSCTLGEYGDPFDIMGSSAGYKHLNNYHKGQTASTAPNWYQTYNTQNVTQPGTYTITPIETASAGVQALRLPKTYNSSGVVTKWYYLEFRQPFGFDNFTSTAPVVNGVTIRLANEYNSAAKSWLIDATSSTNSFTDSALLPGFTFNDPDIGLTVTTLSVSAQGASVKVDFGPDACLRAPPSVSINPLSTWGSAGETRSYTLTIVNNDGTDCGNATINFSSQTERVSQSPATGSVVLAPGKSQNVSLSLSSSKTVKDGSYAFTNTATHAISGFASSVTGYYHIGAVDPSPTPTSSPMPPPNPSDLDGDGDVDYIDLLLLLKSTTIFTYNQLVKVY
jgi:hypothetical protein